MWYRVVYSQLFSAAHYVRLVLAVVELVLSAEFLVFVPSGEELQLGEAAGELVRVQIAADLTDSIQTTFKNTLSPLQLFTGVIRTAEICVWCHYSDLLQVCELKARMLLQK